MNTLQTRSLVTAYVLLALVGTAWAATPVGFGVEVSSVGQYVWRGALVTDGPVLQTSSTIGYRGAHLNVWTNQDLDRVNGRRAKISELDFDAGYDYVREKVTFSAGGIRYTFPTTGLESTAEVYAGIASQLPLNPSVRAYFDVDAVKGSYVTFDLSHNFALPKLRRRMTWAIQAAAGAACASARHNAAYYGVERSALADFHPSVSLPVSYRKLRLTPRVSYGMLLDGALRRGPLPKAHNFYVGISAGWEL
jgi:Bacterial protein of unknown function (Gcw_chp)